jgi:hypothetical protein
MQRMQQRPGTKEALHIGSEARKIELVGIE